MIDPVNEDKIIGWFSLWRQDCYQLSIKGKIVENRRGSILKICIKYRIAHYSRFDNVQYVRKNWSQHS